MTAVFDRFNNFINCNKYEFLLLGLLQHLFIAIFLTDLEFYSQVVWPINMAIVGVTSVGVFSGKSKKEIYFKNFLLAVVIILPVFPSLFRNSGTFLIAVSVIYVIFFGFIFYEVFRFLVRPDAYTTDVLSAAGCGYLLLIEIFSFLFQFLLYSDPHCMNVKMNGNVAETFIDLVYFTTISLATIGYGDIAPTAHYTKLITALMGLIGTFYTVVLTGILISNFAPNLLKERPRDEE